MNLIQYCLVYIFTHLSSILISIASSKNFFVKNKKIIKEKNTNDCQNLCLLFIFNKPKIFTNYLIIALKKLNFKILLITNINKKGNYHITEEYLNLADILIYRENYGRDFGAYKDGIIYLKRKNFFNASNFLILNNTFIVDPKKIFVYLKDFLESSQKYDVNSPFISNQNDQLHFQSFFILFRNKIFLDKDFLNYWKNYLPFSSRYYTLKQGELKLSQVLKKYNCNSELTYPIQELNSNYTFLNQLQFYETLNNGLKIENFNPSVSSFINSYIFKKIPIFKISISENKFFYYLIYPELKRIFLENNINDFDLIKDLFKLNKKKTFIYKLKKILQII